MTKIGGIARNLRSAGELLAIQEEAETPVFKTLCSGTFGMYVLFSICVGCASVCVCALMN